jgi:imidazolonepropionase-like amidohydrolase
MPTSPRAIASALFVLLTASGPAAQPSAGAPPPAQVKALKFGRLIDGRGGVLDGAVVLVEGDRIRAVQTSKTAIPPDAEVIDLGRFTGIPGLIDVHTHMTYYWDRTPGSSPWEQGLWRTSAVNVSLAAENARKTLEAGVTTVRDLGALDYADLALRDLINSGAMTGPRMFVSGHALHVTMFVPPRAGFTWHDDGIADSVPDIARAIRLQIAAGADVIKMIASSGTGSNVSGQATYTAEEIRMAVDVTHRMGKRIAVHSYGPDAARDAIAAGADSVEHAVGLDDAALAQMARRGIVYVPTIDHNRYYAESRAIFNYNDADVTRLNEFIAKNIETARRAHKAGVRIAMGSDAVFTMFGQNAHELTWLVKAGMTPRQALEAATVNGAALLGMDKELGAIAAGFYADIVAVEGDPLADIDAVVSKVRWVMKGGAPVVDRTATAKP